jgi:hypothetical protein
MPDTTIHPNIVETATALVTHLATLGITATIDYAPDYVLPAIATKKTIVVPVGIEGKVENRMPAKNVVYVIEIGVMQKGKSLDFASLITEVETLGRNLMGRTINGMVCISAEHDPLYDPDFAKSNQFTSVLSLRFKGVVR